MVVAEFGVVAAASPIAAVERVRVGRAVDLMRWREPRGDHSGCARKALDMWESSSRRPRGCVSALMTGNLLLLWSSSSTSNYSDRTFIPHSVPQTCRKDAWRLSRKHLRGRRHISGL